MVGTIPSFDFSILAQLYAPRATGGQSGGVGDAMLDAKRMTAAQLAKLPPWDQRVTQTSKQDLLRTVMRQQTLFDANWKTLKSAKGPDADNQRLFGAYKAARNLEAIADAAAKNGVSASQRARYQDRFEKGLEELNDYLSGLNVDRADLIKGKRNNTLESRALSRPETVFGGRAIWLGLRNESVTTLEGAQSFTLRMGKNGNWQNVDIDLSGMGSQTRSVDNVAAFVNSKLAEQGYQSRLRVQSVVDETTGRTGYGFNFFTAEGETVSFPDSPGTGGAAAPGGNLIQNGDFSQFQDPLWGGVQGDRGQYATLTNWTAWQNGSVAAQQDFNLEFTTAGMGFDTDNALGTGVDAISQTVNTEAGKTYVLSWQSQRNGGSGVSGSGDYEVLWNGQVVRTVSVGLDNGTLGYQVEIQGTGAPGELMFRELGANDGYGSLIDNVRMMEKTATTTVGGTSPPAPPRVLGQNMLVNGSFEADNVTGQQSIEPTAWDALKNTNNYWQPNEGSGGIFVVDGGAGSGSDGSQYVNLDGAIRKTINTDAGHLSDRFRRAPLSNQRECGQLHVPGEVERPGRRHDRHAG
jgi:hypothetical protein